MSGPVLQVGVVGREETHAVHLGRGQPSAVGHEEDPRLLAVDEGLGPLFVQLVERRAASAFPMPDHAASAFGVDGP
jgi:hypothetical protein